MNFNSLFCAFGRVLAKRERIQVRSESAVGRAFLALLLDTDTSHALFRSELCSGRFGAANHSGQSKIFFALDRGKCAPRAAPTLEETLTG